jgi:hypothetical protein
MVPQAEGLPGTGSPCAKMLPALRGKGTVPVASNQLAPGNFVPGCFYFANPGYGKIVLFAALSQQTSRLQQAS